jgi:hypothetical protein
MTEREWPDKYRKRRDRLCYRYDKDDPYRPKKQTTRQLVPKGRFRNYDRNDPSTWPKHPSHKNHKGKKSYPQAVMDRITAPTTDDPYPGCYNYHELGELEGDDDLAAKTGAWIRECQRRAAEKTTDRADYRYNVLVEMRSNPAYMQHFRKTKFFANWKQSGEPDMAEALRNCPIRWYYEVLSPGRYETEDHGNFLGAPPPYPAKDQDDQGRTWINCGNGQWQLECNPQHVVGYAPSGKKK